MKCVINFLLNLVFGAFDCFAQNDSMGKFVMSILKRDDAEKYTEINFFSIFRQNLKIE